MESIWWVLSRSGKTYLSGIPGSALLSQMRHTTFNFEVNEGYKDTTGPSITVSFPLQEDSSVKILVGLHTLDSPLKCGTGSRARHPLRKVKDGDDIFILAKDRLGSYYKDLSLFRFLLN